MYLIKHIYDEDGGFGDAVRTEETIGYKPTEDEAKAYCEKWSNPHVYARPYNSLYCGILKYEKLKPAPDDPYLRFCNYCEDEDEDEDEDEEDDKEELK